MCIRDVKVDGLLFPPGRFRPIVSTNKHFVSSPRSRSPTSSFTSVRFEQARADASRRDR